MFGRTRAHLRRHAVAYVALFLVLSSSAYALGRGQVKTRHLAKGAVSAAKLADRAVKTRKIADGAVTRAKLAADALAHEDWIAVGSPGTPFNDQGFICKWENQWSFDDGLDHHAASFARDPLGFVRLRGLVELSDAFLGDCSDEFFGAVNRVVFSLPEGYRPPGHQYFSTVAADNPATIRIEADTGNVVAAPPTEHADVFHWLSLDGITFRCAPSGVNGCP